MFDNVERNYFLQKVESETMSICIGDSESDLKKSIQIRKYQMIPKMIETRLASANMNLAQKSGLINLALLGLILLSELNEHFAEARDKGDDIILSKGKIIMRGGKGKGNIIVDPGSSSDEGHSMPPMMSLMGHFNPYAFYPMQSHHQPQHHQAPMMIHPIYLEDHSAMHQHHHQPEHQQEQHHEQHHEHHQEEQQHHYEPQHHEMAHQEHYEPQHHEPMHQQQYEHESGEHHGGGGGEEEQQHHHGGYEHQGHEHPLMAMMMHGSGPQPAYQQMSAMQAMQQQPGLYGQIPMDQQQAAAYQAQMEAAIAEQQQTLQQQQLQQQAFPQSQSTNEVAQSSSSTTAESSAKPPNKAIALLEKTAANNPLVKIIKPLFKRNKEHKEAANQQSKP